MGYYMAGRGDYYRSGGRGDPGFLSFLSKAGSFAAGMIPGIGPIASKVVEAGTSALTKLRGAPIVKRAVAPILAHPVLSAAGAAGVVGTAAGMLEGKHMGSPAAAGLASTGRMLGGGGRRRRRMNPYNPRALRRALRRTHSFAKMAMQIIRVSKRYKHPKRFRIGHFKKKSRK